MFLFILESIGTSELILIGIIALIFLGPRKLPQMAKKIGKTMAEFRSTTNEFKATWQREVDFEEEVTALRTGDLAGTEPATIGRTGIGSESTNTIAVPEIKPVQTELFESLSAAAAEDRSGISLSTEPNEEVAGTEESDLSDKRNWL